MVRNNAERIMCISATNIFCFSICGFLRDVVNISYRRVSDGSMFVDNTLEMRSE